MAGVRCTVEPSPLCPPPPHNALPELPLSSRGPAPSHSAVCALSMETLLPCGIGRCRCAGLEQDVTGFLNCLWSHVSQLRAPGPRGELGRPTPREQPVGGWAQGLRGFPRFPDKSWVQPRWGPTAIEREPLLRGRRPRPL